MVDDHTTTGAPAPHGMSPAHGTSDMTALPRHDSPNARRAFARTLRPVRGRVIRACVCEGVGAAARLGVGLLAAGALTELVAGRTHDRGWWQRWLLVALAAVIVAWFGQWVGLLLAHRADNALQRNLRERLVDRIRASSLTWVDQHGSVLVKRIVAEDVDALHHLVGHALGHMVAAAVQTVLGLAVLLAIAAVPTLVALVPTTAALLLARHQRRRLPAQMARYQEASARVDRAGVEFVHGIAPLKIFGGVASGLQRFRKAAAEYADFVSQWAASVTPSMVGQQVLLAAPAVWAALAVLALVTPVSAAQAVAVAIVLPLLLSPVESLAFAVQDLAGAVAASSRIDAVLADDSAADQAAHTGAEPAVREFLVREPAAEGAADWGVPVAVTLDGVGVRLGEHVALDRVSATLPAGGTTVLLGHSGSGKSTLLEVIAGLRRPSVGAVRRNPADAPVTALWQRPFLLRASVRDNVCLTRPDATDAECLAAVADAHVTARVEALDGGYDAIVGDQLALSGGEQQRLCLARALLARPRLLLLDEPTSAVDPTSARLVDDTLARLHGRTTIVRADHRPAIALTADLVLVLEAGRIVESGPPAHLLDAGGRFARLVDGAARTLTHEGDS